MNLRYCYFGIIALIICSAAFLYVNRPDNYQNSREEIAFRQLGHELLLSAKDSTSRVMPVHRASGLEFKLEFEKPFSIIPDSLVKVVDRVMSKNHISDEYVVNVVEVKSKKTVFGFAISKPADDILACGGRLLPEKKYLVNIILRSKANSVVSRNNLPLIALLLLVSISGTIYLKRYRSLPDVANAVNLNSPHILLGSYSYYPGSQVLVFQNNPVALTPKEKKLLNIFAGDINTVIDRNRLLKEGWEDEGVITQRSLDMYVSRLRKKLMNDPSIRITNVHGKGYCLSTEKG